MYTFAMVLAGIAIGTAAAVVVWWSFDATASLWLRWRHKDIWRHEKAQAQKQVASIKRAQREGRQAAAREEARRLLRKRYGLD